VAKAMEVFLSQRWLKVEDRKVMVNLWKWYIKNMHFVDSFLLAWVKENKGKILSFDKKLLQAT
jgi:predicted nucleic acid-binding protein